MIKRLRRKFILISMLTFFTVLTLLVGALNVVNYVSGERSINGMLELLTNNRGIFPGGRPDVGRTPLQGDDILDDLPGDDNSESDAPEKSDDKKRKYGNLQMTPETPYATRYFVVEFDGRDGSIVGCNTDHIAAVSAEDAIEYASGVIESGTERGSVGGIYRYAVLVRDTGVSTIAFLDCRDQLSSRRTLLLTSIIVELICLIAAFIPVFLLSGRAIRPAVESMEKQRRFITDASHEIKTPLAIISANTEVLEMTQGGNEWIDSIKNQTSRLSKLVARLVMLSKMDEERPQLDISDFDMSGAVIDAAAPFRTVAECSGRSLNIAVEPNISYHGDEGAIRQLVSLLTENAVKYSDEHGEIKVELSHHGRERVLRISNMCSGFDRTDIPNLFDRFYRADASRARSTGGYGIGLSVAKAICEAHGGSISADCSPEGLVSFTAIL